MLKDTQLVNGQARFQKRPPDVRIQTLNDF